jgi:hypothetical protein
MNASDILPIATASLATLLGRLPSIAQDLVKYSFLPAFLLYPILCSSLRFRKRNAMHKKFHYPDRKSFASMTNSDAQQIVKYIAQWEFPKMYTTSLQFGLFKVRLTQVWLTPLSALMMLNRLMVFPPFPSCWWLRAC